MPDGGRIAYQNIPGSGSPSDAMIVVLKAIHQSLGARPQVTQCFRDKSGLTIGAFFTVPSRAQNKPALAGLALVNAPSPDHRSGAAVIDYATSFGKNLRPMVARLSQEWPSAGSKREGDSAPAAPAMPLQTLQFQDGTGQIGLPYGWRPKFAGGGAVSAMGPNGEELYFNDSANNLDPTNPQGRNLIVMLTRNGASLPNHSFANAFRQGDVSSFISTMQQRAHKMHQPNPTIEISSRTVGQDNSINYLGTWDAHDGRGAMALVAMVRVMAPMANGSWTMFMYHMRIPMSHLSEEAATIPSIWQSFKTNDKLIMAMNKGITQQILAAGDARNRAFDASQRRSSGTGASGIDEQEDANARGAQAVCNYIRGNAVIGDLETGGQATVDNNFADALVKANPDRLEIIQPSQFNQGRF